MKIKYYLMVTALGLFSSSLFAQDYLLSTPNTSLLITATPGEKVRTQYYGSKIEPQNIQGIYNAGLAFNADGYPTFGLKTMGEKAMAVTFPDGNMSLDLVVKQMQYPMSNLQGAGMGFCFNETYTDPKGATFCAMVRGENGYHKIPFMDKTEVKANTYYHLLFTWDGAQICTYKNGAFVSSTACNVLKMPGGDAQYICIGADSGNKPTDQAANGFNGEVAIARVYDKAVSASEVASLYKQLDTRTKITVFNQLNSLLTGGTLNTELSTEGWRLMNDLATTEAEVEAFIAKVN